MDPPDVLGLDMKLTRPTQLPGRSKKPVYDPVIEEESAGSLPLKKLSLKKHGPAKSLKLNKPAARVSATKLGDKSNGNSS